MTTNAAKSLPPWITLSNGIYIYAFNVFNNDHAKIDQAKLTAIIAACVKDHQQNFSKDYGCSIDCQLYTLADMSNANLFKGDRIPILIGAYGDVGGYHAVQVPKGDIDQKSFFFSGCNLSDVSPAIAKSAAASLPNFTPYMIIGSNLEIYYALEANVHGINPTTVPVDTYYQVLALVLSHEFHELLVDDSTLNFIGFDHFAPMVQNLKIADFDANGACTNGTSNPDGFRHLPNFLQRYPRGGIFQCIKEAGDPVSFGESAVLQSYLIDGWMMQNYPLPTFWQPYLTGDLKYDHLGFVKVPMQPYAGMHEFILFTSFDTGVTYIITMTNFGPITATMRGAPARNNFPPDITFATIVTGVRSGIDGSQLVEEFDYYGVKRLA